VIRHVQATGRPLVLTEGGHGVAVLLSMEAFENLQVSTERLELQKAVDEAEQEIERGAWVENEEIVAKLKRWAGEA
jgi:PHD/YefM family antitoxin component YafN of YafNO toxin-antitoxin module